ncbi:MAG TPA: polysaccharide deacetylase family protein [Gaiellaceae bacterium]|nr:polysaccharide deacetylase family protein [Gaiellaceae bacterium]
MNYHATPQRDRERLARQLDRLLTRYRPGRAEELEALLATGAAAPTLIVTFDDGLADHLEVAAPLLEERGLTGIFAVPADFPSVPAGEQPAWYREHAVDPALGLAWGEDDLRGLDWDGVRELARRGHRVAVHTASHVRLTADTPREILEREIVEARARVDEEIGAAADGFCWPWGRDPSAAGADALVRATYRYALVGEAGILRAGADPHVVARTNLEAHWPDEIVDLQLSRLADLRSTLRRLGRSYGAAGSAGRLRPSSSDR